MRLASIFALMIGAAAGWKDLAAVHDATDFLRFLDAPPEALMIGGGLLMLASLLRLRFSGHAK